MQCKDIPDAPILEFLRDLPTWEGSNVQMWGTWFPSYPNSVQAAMPPLPTEKLALAKMRQLIRRGLVGGCPCGCRGDFELTEKGRLTLLHHRA